VIVALAWCLCVLVLLPATVAAGYYFALTVTGLLGGKQVRSALVKNTHITVLVPAHNEAACIAKTLDSLAQCQYPRDFLHVVVVADNCSDQTAEIARKFGATVYERHDHTERGKGYALAFGLSRILATPTDAVMILDADCTVSSGLLQSLANLLADGHEAIQAALLSRNADAGPSGYVAAVGAEIDHLLAVGQDRLSGTVPLRGTGMLFRRELLTRIPWTTTGLVEDAEYAAILRDEGVKVAFLASETVSSVAPDGVDAFAIQRRRWRQTVQVKGQQLLPRLLASKPIVLLQLFSAGVVVLSVEPFLNATTDWCFALWFSGLCLMTGFVYLRAMYAVGLNRRRIALLWQSLHLVVRMGWITLGGFWQRNTTWQRTPRSQA
jgi:1,2-diacylglycerol 3-beta-glucosyltransferase